jgi:hypothetical protein
MVRRVGSSFAVIAVLICFAACPVLAQSGRIFYVDSVSGSNSNSGTSESSPWKSAPYMTHSSACDGGVAPSYAHQAGDKFVFKGGSTWGAGCFDMILTAGGTSSAQDYYGVCLSTDSDSPCYGGTSWPSSGWTRPQFNLGGSTPYNDSIGVALIDNPGAASASAGEYGYITFDNIEISNWDTEGSTNDEGGAAIVMGGVYASTSAPGTIAENMYIHDWVTNENITSNAEWVGYAVVFGVNTLKNSTISDANGHYEWNGTVYDHVSMGGCEGCYYVYDNTIHDGWECTSRVYSTHDNDCYNITQGAELGEDIHSHIIYDDGAGQNSYYVYNNAIHDSLAGLNINLFYHAAVFNNVMWNLGNNVAIYLEQCAPGQGTAPCGDSSSSVGYVANNTMDMTTGTGDGAACYNWYGSEGLGTLNLDNNICIGGVGSFSVASINAGGPGSGTYPMGTTEASNDGFTAANLYSPSVADPNVGSGANLTSSCSGILAALCMDASGAPWFGGSYASRPAGTTPWMAGAFVFGANASQSNSKPTAPTNLTASVE